jgi:hypothetical protein
MRYAIHPGYAKVVAVDSVIACGAIGTAVSAVLTKSLLDIAPRSTHRRNTVYVPRCDIRGDLR